MRKKGFFLAGLAVCLLVGFWGYHQYHKPRSGVGAAKADYEMSAVDLFAAFNQDEAAANHRYTNKVIQVAGTVQELQTTDANTILILKGGDIGGVSCRLAEAPNPLPKAGAEVSVKGRCTGFLMDVNLVDAILIH